MELKEIKIMLKGKVPEFARKVKPIYSLLEWTWGSKDTIPSIEEIKSTLYEIIDGLDFDGDFIRTGTGGLIVEIDTREGQASLSMVIDEFLYFDD